MTRLEQSVWRRDRATQAALNFAGQVISSADGTYALLIEVISDAMREAEDVEREACAAICDGREREHRLSDEDSPIQHCASEAAAIRARSNTN